MLFSNYYPIGLDISDSSIKLIQLSGYGNKLKIQAAGRADIPLGVFKKGEIVQRGELMQIIKNLLTKPQFGHVDIDEVAVCLPENKTFLKMVKFDRSPNDIKHTIEMEIEKNIPLSLDDIYYDWQIVKTTREHDYALVGATPKKITDEYSSLFQELEMSVTAFEAEPIAICRGLLAEENPRFKDKHTASYCIIDIGADRTFLTVYSKNTLIFSISIPLSGNQITDEVSRILEINPEQAEKAKIICGLDDDKAQGVIKNILANMTDNLAKKIKNSLDFYRQNFSTSGKIDKIYLCGGGANIKNLDKIITEKLNIPTVIGDPLIHLSLKNTEMEKIFNQIYQKEVENNKKNAALEHIKTDSAVGFTTSIGLALRSAFIDH